jgi:hypothetical protein
MGRPKLRWMDGVKIDVNRKGLNIEDARMCVYDRARRWRVVHSEYINLSCLNHIAFGVSRVEDLFSGGHSTNDSFSTRILVDQTYYIYQGKVCALLLMVHLLH